jgi:hypothetical protein
METWKIDVYIIVLAMITCRVGNNQEIGRLDILAKDTRGSSLNSKVWLDYCSLVHFGIGMLLQKMLVFIPVSNQVRHILMVMLVSGFEIGENNPQFVKLWADASYTGDSLSNVLTDIIAAMIGYELAKHLPFYPTIIAAFLLIKFSPCRS